jgi:hypothetical protein
LAFLKRRIEKEFSTKSIFGFVFIKLGKFGFLETRIEKEFITKSIFEFRFDILRSFGFFGNKN